MSELPSCPRCSSPLYAGNVGHLSAYGCGRCGGLWLDNGGTREVLDRYDIDAANLARVVDDHAVESAAAPPLTPATGACPFCSAPLVSTTYDGVGLDFCAQHGTFFDRGELVRLLQSALANAPRPARVLPDAPVMTRTEVRHEIERLNDPIGTAVTDWLYGGHAWVDKRWTR